MNTPSVALQTSALDAIITASPVVQFVLLILVTLSVLSWAIGIMKFRQFQSLNRANEPFANRFWKTTSLDSLYEDVDQFPNSSLARLFKAGYAELQKLAAKPDSKGGESMLLSGSDNLERALKKEVDVEIASMESRLTLLATTGSTGPFIGLLGTVWGIMGAFQKIGTTGSASLAVVAPGIAEALIATAIGLAAAIPAVIMYNNFVAEIRKQEMQLTNFMTDFLNVAKRNFFKE